MNTTPSVSEKRDLFPIFPGKFFAILFVMAAFLFPQDRAYAAITVAQVTQAATTTASTTQATAAFTPVANTLYLMWTIQTIGTAPTTVPTVACANGLTMVQVNTVVFNTTGTPLSRLTLFRAMKPSGLSNNTCTITWGQTTTGHGHVIVAFTGADTSGTDGSGAVVQSVTGATNSATAGAGLSIALAALQASSTSAGGFSNAVNSATSLTAGAGYTTGTGVAFGTPSTSLRAEWDTTGTTTVNMTQSATSNIGGIAVEVKAFPTTTLATGTDPAAATIAPGAAATDVDLFTLQTDIGTEAITSVTVNLSTNSGVGRLAITDNAGTELGFTTSPVTGSNTITVAGMSATTTLTTFKVRVTPLSHAAMPVPPGAAYAITAPVTAWAGSNTHAGSDTNPNALTIDNLSPSGATAVSGSAGAAQVTLNWTTSASADFSRSVVLRWTGGSAGAQVPAEGTDYVNGNTIGTATVVCVRTTDTASTAVSDVDGAGSGGCSASALTIGQAYTYKIFQKDSNGNYDVGVALGTFTPVLMVVSINRADINPATSGTSVSWTVVFSASVTGVDSGDFTLVQAGGVSGASITAVTGSGTTWTVTVNTGSGTGTLGLNLVDNDTIVDGSGNKLGGTGAGNGNFTGQVYSVTPPCLPPSNIPGGVTVSCQCDNFGRASLNPSTIFGGNWNVSTGSTDTTGIVPYINSTTNLLRLTENTGNNAKAATVPGIFPAAGNYISVEFNDYAYNGSTTGADGIAVTLSDYSVPAVPGGFGGSLGYAQRTDSVPNPPGFAGGWVGVGLDEYGNYQSSTEGRVLGACGTAACLPQSIGVRGPGTGTNGYRWMGGTGSNPGGNRIDTANRTSTTPGPGYMYQVIVDARNAATGTINISVNQDATTKNGSTYTSLFGPFNAYTEANYALSQGWISQIVPNYWTISFTGSTGGSTNIHEIGGLRICAQTIIPPTGGTASGFSAIDEAYPAAPTVPAYQNFQTGHIYMKVSGTSFNLWVAALASSGVSTGYSATSSKYVAVKLVDNSDNACGPDSARTCNAAACTSKTAVEAGAGATQIATFPSGGTTGVASPSPTFTLNSAWKNLIAVMKECTTSACTAFTATAPACSVDSFSVRPTSIASVKSIETPSGAGNAATNTGTSMFKAGSGTFNLTATVTGITNYTGTPKINSASVQAFAPATSAGTLAGTFSAATPSGLDSAATGNAFTYSEVGAFKLAAPTFTVPIPGVYDDSWTAIDSDPLKNDCISGTTATAYSNSKTSGKYGCNFGITADTGAFGRFIPHHFDVTKIHGCTGGATFTYSGQPFTVTATARNFAGTTTQNYHGAYGLSKDTTISNAGAAANFTNNVLAAANFINGVRTQGTVTYTFPVTAQPKETAPTTLTLRAIDTDGVSSAGATEETAEIRSGRVHISNAYGSELVDLPMPMQVEYYADTTITAPLINPPTTGWIANVDDTCSSVSLSAFSNYQGNLNAGETCVQDTGNPGLSGQGCAAAGPLAPVNERYLALPSSGGYNLYLKAPGSGNQGSVDITANLATKTWLRFDWNGAGEVDPTGRATFGLYRGSPRHIYLRER